MINEARRVIPLDVKRQLRQEAGFGCCRCGSPILQYHHIVPWAEEQHCRPEDMMVLCPNHHDQATKGAMPMDEQRELKSAPHNMKRGHAQGLLEIKQDYCAADLGSITVVGEGSFLRIDGTDILSLYMGPRNLEISLRLFSETNEMLAEIDRNEWVSGDPMPWDIEADWQKLILRERARRISISLDARQKPLKIEGEFWYSNRKITVNKDRLLIHGNTTMGLSNLALVGGGVDLDTEGIRISSADGKIVVWHNPRERLWKAHDIWKRIKKERDRAS